MALLTHQHCIMKILASFLFLFMSTPLFSQLDKISRIEVNDSTIILNDSVALSYPMNTKRLISLLGEARISDNSESPNDVYYWYRLGVLAFTNKGDDEITSFDVCLSRSSVGPNTRRKFRGQLIIHNSTISKRTRTSTLSDLGFATREPDSILPSWHDLELEELQVIVETERKDKRTTGVGISKKR